MTPAPKPPRGVHDETCERWIDGTCACGQASIEAERTAMPNCPREHGDGEAPSDCICVMSVPQLVAYIVTLEAGDKRMEELLARHEVVAYNLRQALAENESLRADRTALDKPRKVRR